MLWFVHFSYDNFQEKKQLKKANTELYERIEQLNQSIAKSNRIIANNEKYKRVLENKSIERQEQIDEQVNRQAKKHNCDDYIAPVSVSNELYNRAKSLRQSANTGESTKRQYSRATTKINEIRG